MLPLLPDLNVPSPPAITQHKLEAALLALGQFQHALAELMAWLTHTEELLDAQKPVNGDPKVIEVELAKHHVSAPTACHLFDPLLYWGFLPYEGFELVQVHESMLELSRRFGEASNTLPTCLLGAEE